MGHLNTDLPVRTHFSGSDMVPRLAAEASLKRRGRQRCGRVPAVLLRLTGAGQHPSSVQGCSQLRIEGSPAGISRSLTNRHKLDLMQIHHANHARDVSTSPHIRSVSTTSSIKGASGDALLYAKAPMKDFPVPIPGLSADFASRDDERLFAFISTLRLTVKAKVAADQQRGLSLSDIVGGVRELVRISEEDARKQQSFPTGAFRAISRQAVAWCVEAYRPPAFNSGADVSVPDDTNSRFRSIPVPIGASVNRFPEPLTIPDED